MALQSATDPGDDPRGVPAVIELYDVLIAPKTCAKDTNRAGQMTQTAPIEYAGMSRKPRICIRFELVVPVGG